MDLPPYAPSGLSLYFLKTAYVARRMPVYLVNNSQHTLREVSISIRILSFESPHVFVIPGIDAAAGDLKPGEAHLIDVFSPTGDSEHWLQYAIFWKSETGATVTGHAVVRGFAQPDSFGRVFTRVPGAACVKSADGPESLLVARNSIEKLTGLLAQSRGPKVILRT